MFVIDIVISAALALVVTAGHLAFALAGNLVSVSGDPKISRMLSLYVLGQALGIFPPGDGKPALCFSFSG